MPRKFLLATSLERIEERLHVHLSSYTKVLPASYNISGGKATYVITTENPHELQAMQFGMTPYFAKKPYLMYLQERQRPFAMAGLYDYWQNPDTKEILSSFSIITISANPLLQSIGIKRMPVILRPGYERD